jgi:hypothetical protein
MPVNIPAIGAALPKGCRHHHALGAAGFLLATAYGRIMGIIDTISLAGTLVLALPIGMLGVEFLVGGETAMGVGFVAVAAALVVGQHYIGGFDIKERIAGRAVDAVVLDEDEVESVPDESDADTPEGYRK